MCFSRVRKVYSFDLRYKNTGNGLHDIVEIFLNPKINILNAFIDLKIEKIITFNEIKSATNILKKLNPVKITIKELNLNEAIYEFPK